MDTAANIIERITGLGGSISASDGQLLVDLPKGAMTADLAAAIRAQKEALLAALAAPAGTSEMTAPQRRMLGHGALHTDIPLYAIPSAWQIEGPIDTARFVLAFDTVAARHDVFRQRVVDGTESPRLRYDANAATVDVVDLSRTGDAKALIEAHIARETRREWDLQNAPAMVATLFLLSPTSSYFFFMPHHIAWDGFSFGLWLRDLAAAYGGDDLPPVERCTPRIGVAAPRAESYWQERLASPPSPPAFPADRPRPALFDHLGHWVKVADRADRAARIAEIASAQTATSFQVWFAAYRAWLSRISGAADTLCGVIRDEREDEGEGLGCFVNTLLIRSPLEGGETLLSLMASLRGEVADAIDHSLPIEDVVGLSELPLDPSRPTGAQALISHQSVASHPAQLGEARLTRVDLHPGTTAAEIVLNVMEGDDATDAYLEFASSLFSEHQAQALADSFAAFLDAALSAPETPLRQLPLMTAAGDATLRRVNDTGRALPEHPSVADWVEALAERTPEAQAIVAADTSLTYQGLQKTVEQFAAGLIAVGVTRGDRVAFAAERGSEMVAVPLAVWRVGAILVPMDPDHPKARRALIAEDADAKLTIGAGGVPVADILAAGEGRDAPSPLAPGEAAYLLYTSGSTGKPKGVVGGHRQLVNFLASMAERPGFTADDALLAVTTLGFDISLLELFLPLTTGGTVVIASRDDIADGALLAARLASAPITKMQGTPATWRLLLDAGWEGSAELDVLCGGEALPRDLVDALAPKVRSLWNMYGPTETTVWSACGLVAPAEPITVGTPIANTQLAIVDAEGQRQPPGLVGEVLIGGDGVALGYYRREELTAERFIRFDFGDGEVRPAYRTGDLGRITPEGELVILGRIDAQVKLRGYRVELGEIEAALGQQEEIAAVAAGIREDAAGEPVLVAWMVLAEGAYITGSDLRRRLRKVLPPYMIPQIYAEVDALPLNANGKVDRAALPDVLAPARVSEHVAPRTEAEAALAGIWADILQTEKVSVTDNFFELGGQSLQAARVAARLRREHGLMISPRNLIFETLEQLAGAAQPVSQAS